MLFGITFNLKRKVFIFLHILSFYHVPLSLTGKHVIFAITTWQYSHNIAIFMFLKQPCQFTRHLIIYIYILSFYILVRWVKVYLHTLTAKKTTVLPAVKKESEIKEGAPRYSTAFYSYMGAPSRCAEICFHKCNILAIETKSQTQSSRFSQLYLKLLTAWHLISHALPDWLLYRDRNA